MKLNWFVITLGSILALVSITIGCSKPVKESAAAVKTANDAVTTGGGKTIAMARGTISSTNNTFDVSRSLDQRVDSSPEFEITQRLWQDYEYLFSTDATLTGFTPDKRSVKLLKANGVEIEVEISILCDEDQEYVNSIPDYQREKLGAN